ncbi:hypothetical protein SAMN05421754_101162 [Nitrosomonas sp. Nm58]|nr:hypothetical protein SAMN05421754_101162 [Nitrosomonas sp. Nm58]
MRSHRRFIPTGVGNTAYSYPVNPSIPVHPHGRGEHHFNTATSLDFARFIPTGVGNTSRCSQSGRGHPVHPHGRGEHLRNLSQSENVYGSIPRAWGTLDKPQFDCCTPRFIPTGVGNTAGYLFREYAIAVHPHGRGEHLVNGQPVPLANGSSPRAWGTPQVGVLRYRPIRFIPTGVGNTISGWSRRPTLPVHPHGRGEHYPMFFPSPSPCGSSPRAWGTREIKDADKKTHPVHPHGRGEHLFM